jgi:hypothetical protein
MQSHIDPRQAAALCRGTTPGSAGCDPKYAATEWRWSARAKQKAGGPRFAQEKRRPHFRLC